MGSSLKYVGELRQGIWPFVPLRLCGWVRASRFTTEAKRYREFPIQVHPFQIARSPQASGFHRGAFGLPADGVEGPRIIGRELDLARWIS